MALRDKQAAFVVAYLATFNATEAARQAKYTGNDATLASVGWENLRKPEIADAISQRLSETAMGADEVLNRLADHARADIKDFLAVSNNGDVALDITAAGGKTHLIKKVTQRHSTRTTKDSVTVDVVLTLELHDAQAALVNIGKHHKLFADRTEISGPGGGPIQQTITTLSEWHKQQEKLRQQAGESLKDFEGDAQD